VSEQKMSESQAKSLAQIKDAARLSKHHESEVAKLNEELEVLRKTHVGQAASLEAGNTETQNQLDDAFEQLGAMAEAEEELKSRVQALLGAAQEKVSLETAAHGLTAENDKLKADVQQREALITQIEQDRDSLNETIVVSASKIEDLQRQLKSLVSEKENFAEKENQLLAVQKERDEVMHSVARYEENITSIQEQLKEANVQNQQLLSQSSEIASNHNVLSDLQVRLNDQEAVARLNEEQLLEKENIISSLSIELEGATDERDFLSKTSSELQETIRKLQTEQSEAGAEVTESKSRLKQLEQDLKIATERHHGTLEQVRNRDEIEAHLRRDMDMLLSERDSILDEKRELDEDCEEMLVQLGLNKEQMEANEKEIVALHDALCSSETANVRTTDSLRAAEESARRMEQMNNQLQLHQHENGSHRDAETNRLGVAVEKLTVENADLTQQVDDLTSAKAYTDDELHKLTSEIGTLRAGFQDRESASLQQGELEEIKTDLESRLKESEDRYTHLDGVCVSQTTEIDRLVESVQLAEATVQEVQHSASTSHSRIQHLEKSLTQREETLRQKDRAIQETRQQLDDFRRMSEGSDNDALAEMSKTVDDLSLRLRDSENFLHEERMRLRELEAALAAGQEEAKQLKEKLSRTEEALLNMELEMDTADSEAAAREEYEALLSQAKERHAAQEACIQEADIIRANLEIELSAAVSDLQIGRQRAAAGVDQGQHQVADRDQEIQRLQFEILQLQREKESIDAEKSIHDEIMRKEIAELRIAVEKKASKLSSLEQHVQSLSVELSTNKHLLGLKEEELQRVSIELEEDRANQIEATQRVAAKVLDSDISKEEAESTDNMRGLIISLSQALEKSESQRADAIERLLRERKTSADSLRRLGESVKRFYSTLNGATS